MLRELGDSAGSIQSSRRALALDPTNITVYLQIAASFGDRMDSVLATLEAAARQAKTNDDSLRIYNSAFAPGQTLFNEVSAVPDSLKTEVEWDKFKRALTYLEFSHRMNPSPHAKFYQAAIHFFVGLRELSEAHKLQATDAPRTCALATSSYDHWQQARGFIEGGGGGVSREHAVAWLGNITDNTQILSDLKAAFCKPGYQPARAH
jgi:hypothetical protein